MTRWVHRTSALTLAALVAQGTGCGTGSSGGAGDQRTPASADTTTARPAAVAAQAGPARQVDWAAVDAAMGREGAEQAGGVRRYGMPRGDLRVTAGGVRIRPSLALGSWVAMLPTARGVMAMGDLVLREGEVAPVMSRLQQGGVEQTAMHHHLLHESPRVVYMHVHATGDPVKIAETVRAAVALTGTPAAPAGGAAQASRGDAGDAGGAGGAGGTAVAIDTAGVARILGRAGKVNGGVYQVSVPRAETLRDAGMEVPATMGLATAMNFQPTGGGKAAITGDFVMTADEVNPVIRALREHGIEVTSLHNHGLRDEPRLFYMHFWANDDAVTLARGLRAALDETNVRSAQP
jgi:hypothetical protein